MIFGRKGFTNRGEQDQIVWDEFSADPVRLKTVAATIRANVDSLNPEEAHAETEDITEAEAETGRLACEAWDLDFGERYGERGDGFIECHHMVPVSALKPRQRTKIDDLVLLCSNCHRMVHVRRPWLTLADLVEAQSTG